MSNFSQFFSSGGSLPFAKVLPAYLNGFVRKFPSGNTIIPVPGTSYYFKLPDANQGAGTSAYLTLVDNSTGTVLRTYSDIDYGSPTAVGAYQGLNAFYLDTTTTPATLYGFATNDNTNNQPATTAIVLQTVKFPANAATATTVLTAAAGSVPLPISYAKRGSNANTTDAGGVNTNGAGFAFPDGLGNIILRGIGVHGQGSAQITINMTTGAWTSQGTGWFAGAPSGHSAYYTTANGLVATGGLISDSMSIVNAGYLNLLGGCIDQLVSSGFHVDTAEFAGPEAGFSMTRSSGAVPVLIGTTYLAFISGQTLKYYATTTQPSPYFTIGTSVEPNLYLRADIDALITSINTYYQSRFGV